MDPYAVLGVAPSAGTSEIRAAYLVLARRHHPDMLVGVPSDQRDRAAVEMARVNAAWAVLSDPRRRAAHDATRGSVGPTVTKPDDTWSPYDDDLDPMSLDDEGNEVLHRSVVFVPAVLAIAGAGVTGFGLFVGILPVVALGVFGLGAAVVSFFVVPLLALVASSRSDRE